MPALKIGFQPGVVILSVFLPSEFIADSILRNLQVEIEGFLPVNSHRAKTDLGAKSTGYAHASTYLMGSLKQ